MNTEPLEPYILGVSCFYHDSAACLLRGGDIVAAAQEERFSRKKHDPRFPGITLFRFHIFYRFQSQFGRIQTDGIGTLWRAGIQRSNSNRIDRP